MEHFNSDYLNITLEQEQGMVVMSWKKFVKGTGFRNGLDTGLKLCMEHGISRWLADLRYLKVVDLEDQEWSNSDWFPRAIAGGITSMAIVIPRDVFAKMSVNSIMEKVNDSDLEVHYFEHLEAAREWLSR